MAGTKVYVGGGWTGKYGINLSLNLEKLKGLRTDKYGNIRLAVGQRREVDEKSKQTHYVAEDDYYWSKQADSTESPF
jgi:hypothetical protein